MNSLLLSGHGISMTVDGGKLHVQNGHDKDNPSPEQYLFKPKYINLDNIVVYGHSGNISIDAIRWLVKQNVQLTFLNWDGRLLTNVLPIDIIHSNIKMAQYKAYENGQRVEIAKKFIDAKIQNSIVVLKWLGERYPDVIDKTKNQWDVMKKDWSFLPKARTIREVMGCEGGFAQKYWNIISSVIDERWEFETRVFGKTIRPLGAVDPINALFNYGYSILESRCYKALHSNGLDPNVGFLHEANPSKAPLCYDMQEPFRWLVDVAVLTGLEKKVFTNKDFVRTENYIIRLRPQGVKKLMTELNYQFTRTIKYRNRNEKWENIIVMKGQELGQYIVGKRTVLDLSDPRPVLRRDDNEEMRRKILDMTYTEWRKLGFNKSTLHYLKKHGNEDKPFKIYEKVMNKLKE